MTDRGFTLIELVFVVLVMSTLLGLSAPLFQRSYRRAAWHGAADGLSDLMAYARERAVMERTLYRVDLDAQDDSYGLSVQGPDGFVQVQDRWGRTRRMPPDVTLAADAPFVTFYPDGTASAVQVKLTAPGEDLCLLRVEPSLGRAVVDEKTAE